MPATRDIVTARTRRGASVSGNTTGPVFLKSYAVAGVPAAASYTGAVIYVTNGAAGNPCLAVSNGTNWLRCDTLAAIAAS